MDRHRQRSRPLKDSSLAGPSPSFQGQGRGLLIHPSHHPHPQRSAGPRETETSYEQDKHHAHNLAFYSLGLHLSAPAAVWPRVSHHTSLGQLRAAGSLHLGDLRDLRAQRAGSGLPP